VQSPLPKAAPPDKLEDVAVRSAASWRSARTRRRSESGPARRLQLPLPRLAHVPADGRRGW